MTAFRPLSGNAHWQSFRYPSLTLGYAKVVFSRKLLPVRLREDFHSARLNLVLIFVLPMLIKQKASLVNRLPRSAPHPAP